VNLVLFEAAEAGQPLPKHDRRAVHVLKTLHKKTGGSFDAGIVGGGRGTAVIDNIGCDGALHYTLHLTEAAPRRLPLRFILGFVRPIQLRRIFKELSCMGASEIIIAATELSDSSYLKTQLLDDGGARAALLEGAEQGRETTLPLVRRVGSLSAALDYVQGGSADGALYIAADNVGADGSFAELFATTPPPEEICIAMGPERGFSDGERALLSARAWRRLSLGKRALRAESACIAAATCAILLLEGGNKNEHG
jgi:RsmE family RNA methyltransferase